MKKVNGCLFRKLSERIRKAYRTCSKSFRNTFNKLEVYLYY
ncbi:hypothetical protein HMPREF9447_01959 [Bacteroides oleiciplenus YIT 12058]|uniref:Uncharacterized protein n=1 Tax=Bacteroides oleiciplenus YIT 12058 TaxID=742727 RepID=K9E473_9BACE|nr:hypothetical protein HMPREF9447_01959 [Bacteroides oleiciplenus YIT 12058]